VIERLLGCHRRSGYPYRLPADRFTMLHCLEAPNVCESQSRSHNCICMQNNVLLPTLSPKQRSKSNKIDLQTLAPRRAPPRLTHLRPLLPRQTIRLSHHRLRHPRKHKRQRPSRLHPFPQTLHERPRLRPPDQRPARPRPQNEPLRQCVQCPKHEE